MKPVVSIIDYGVGNLLSVSRSIEYCGAKAILVDTPEQIAASERLILPGVGAFEDGMKGLAERGLIDPIKNHCLTGKLFLGICLGMQMMLDFSEEFGIHQGLGLIPGKVVAIPSTGIDGQSHRIPHIGWNELVKINEEQKWDNTILKDITEKSSVYFVHSFAAIPDSVEHQLANCYYNGRTISAIIKKDFIYGCQFHPEKSGAIGLKILSNFINLK